MSEGKAKNSTKARSGSLLIKHNAWLRVNVKKNTVYLQLSKSKDQSIVIALSIPEALALATYISNQALNAMKNGLTIGSVKVNAKESKTNPPKQDEIPEE